ncbi:MAG TPA: OmpA family protein, partial [Acetobacteraceae bacterium]|nr:OmpA family protein [Acetobacteraceae bacterium]
MSGQLTQEHYKWVAQFCNMPELADLNDSDGRGGLAGGASSQATDDPDAAAPAVASGPDGSSNGGAPAQSGDAGGADSVVLASNVPQPPPPDIDGPALDATDKVVYFSRNSAALTPKDQQSLADYADRYIKAANPTQIVVDAYASVDGDSGYNQKLSDQRAAAVKTYLS